jgi:CheY-like chemotaxis protein
MLALSSPPRQLLLIDDYAPCRQTLAWLLRAAGHTVWEAANGQAGLALLRTHPVEVVVTDLDMPGLTGWDVARLVKATHPHVPVVLVTGSGDAWTPGHPGPLRVDAILRKPFGVAEILGLLDGLPLAVNPTVGDTHAGREGAPTAGKGPTIVRRATQEAPVS